MNMKVEGSGNLRGSSSVRRSGKSEGTSGGSFSQQLVGETPSATGVGASAPLTGVAGVFAFQEVDDAADRASRGKMRAEEMLDRLAEIQQGLLLGTMPRQQLVELTRMVQTRRVQVDDPQLGDILDQIDLRAQVELAKLTS